MTNIVLKEDQQKKADQVIELLRKGEKRINFIGSAGCGKTVAAAWLVDKIKHDRTIISGYNNGMVFVTAPTNKALSVLKSKIDSNVEFKTIHSALKLRRFIDKATGEERFVRTSQGKYAKKQDDFMNCRVCIIDECSMIGKSFIGGFSETKGGETKKYPGYLDDLDIPIIFIGDEKQLNPVREVYSPAFHQGWPTVELTEIIRQGAGNPIIDLSRNLEKIKLKTPSLVDGRGYIYDNYKPQIIDDLAEANGCDDLKYLSWANADVDEMNRLVRERRYGRPNKIEKYETIVFNSPFGGFFTNQEIKVQDLEVFVDYVLIPRHDTEFDRDNQPITHCDKVKLKFYKINGSVNIIHEDSQYMYNTLFQHISFHCDKRGWDWRGKTFFAEQFADVKYNHALTIHKS